MVLPFWLNNKHRANQFSRIIVFMLKIIYNKIIVQYLTIIIYLCNSIIKMELKNLQCLIENAANFRMGMKQYIQQKLREGNFDITYEMLQVLAILWHKQDLNQQQIADAIQKNKASLTPLIDNLACRKLVVRTEDPSDRRNKIISLTKAGRDYKLQFMPVINEFYTLIEKDLTCKEIDQACCVLHKMYKNLIG